MNRPRPDPDFLLPPWRPNYVLDIKSGEDTLIGKYFVFINEQTGMAGVRIEMAGAGRPILAWEDRLIFKIFENSQPVCRYIIYWENGNRKKVRVKNPYPVRIDKAVYGGILNYILYFELATTGEVAVNISVRT